MRTSGCLFEPAFVFCHRLAHIFRDSAAERHSGGGAYELSGARSGHWVDRHSDYFYRYALLHVSNPALVQDTFLSALGALSSFRGDSQERTWLTGILRCKIIDRYRKKRPDFSLDAPGAPEPAGDFQHSGELKGHWKPERAPRDWGTSPDRLMESREFMEILRRCIRRLPEQFASVFALREII